MEHDESRRTWLREERDWTIEVVRKNNVYGREQDIHQILRTAIRPRCQCSRPHR